MASARCEICGRVTETDPETGGIRHLLTVAGREAQADHDALTTKDLVRCWVPECDEVAWTDGPEGIVPHILREHPDSAPGRTIRAELLRFEIMRLEGVRA